MEQANHTSTLVNAVQCKLLRIVLNLLEKQLISFFMFACNKHFFSVIFCLLQCFIRNGQTKVQCIFCKTGSMFSVFFLAFSGLICLYLFAFSHLIFTSKLTLNLFNSCSMTWCVVIWLEIRTLVGVPKDGVKIEVCRTQTRSEETEEKYLFNSSREGMDEKINGGKHKLRF